MHLRILLSIMLMSGCLGAAWADDAVSASNIDISSNQSDDNNIKALDNISKDPETTEIVIKSEEKVQVEEKTNNPEETSKVEDKPKDEKSKAEDNSKDKDLKKQKENVLDVDAVADDTKSHEKNKLTLEEQKALEEKKVAERADILSKISHFYTTIKPGALVNKRIVQVNINYDLKQSIRQIFRCHESQYHIDQPTAVATLKLITYGDVSGPYKAQFYKNPSGATWTAVFTDPKGNKYVVLNFWSKSDDEYIDMFLKYPSYVNYSHHYALQIGKESFTQEALEKRIANLEEITDLSGYQVQSNHMLIVTSDNQLIYPSDDGKSFLSEKLRFIEKYNKNSVVSSDRAAYLAAVKDFTFNTNITALLIDRTNGKTIISDDRDGLFHYLDDKGVEQDNHLSLCYEVD